MTYVRRFRCCSLTNADDAPAAIALPTSLESLLLLRRRHFCQSVVFDLGPGRRQNGRGTHGDSVSIPSDARVIMDAVSLGLLRQTAARRDLVRRRILRPRSYVPSAAEICSAANFLG